ncbi:MAG: glycosyltransferase family 39 protein [Deltaproteobacteria bacterium]|nr:glycosyltransferase family 39 protein [Deltaproteobacteria bacterium]
MSEPTELIAQHKRVAWGQVDRRISLALLLICAGVFLPQMGVYGMYDPWETHYTEVARQFMVRGDWLSTYWHNGIGPDGWSETNFWSKPVGSFWMSGLSLKLFGYGAQTTGETLTMTQVEWAVRLPFFLCALFGIYCLYLMCSRIFGSRAGLLSGIVLATAPLYFMIGRQAMTDMPYVGLISGGLALFILAMFGEERPLGERKKLGKGRLAISWPHDKTFYLFVAAFVATFALQMIAIMPALMRVYLPFRMFGGRVPAVNVMFIYVALAAVFLFVTSRAKTKNEIYLFGFYMATAIAFLAKGLIGALQPGYVIFLYLLVSREWSLLGRVALIRGLMVTAIIGFPWYHGMLLSHGMRFWNDLFGTEQVRRLTIGEQSQAKGTFEYYIKQLGYGLFPWVALLPGALVAGLARCVSAVKAKVQDSDPRDRVRLFLFIWFIGVVILFTLTKTKYHHYILPAIPPGAVLIGIFLDDLLDRRVASASVLLLAGLAVLGVVGFDLVKEPAHWVWMFTYLYTPNWANGVPGYLPILIYTIAFGAAFLLLFWPKLRAIGMIATFAVALLIGGYTLNWYIVGCSPHWSQKTVLQTYYKHRRSPEDQLIAWQFNWRGETWYTAAKVVVSKNLDNKKIIDWLNKRVGRRFYFITERNRYTSLKQMLPTAKAKQTVRIIDNSNVHYILAVAEI